MNKPVKPSRKRKRRTMIDANGFGRKSAFDGKRRWSGWRGLSGTETAHLNGPVLVRKVGEPRPET